MFPNHSQTEDAPLSGLSKSKGLKMNEMFAAQFNRSRIADRRSFRGTSYAGVVGAMVVFACSAPAQSFFFSTGNPDGLMATASRPGTGGSLEIESADDFLVSTPV